MSNEKDHCPRCGQGYFPWAKKDGICESCERAIQKEADTHKFLCREPDPLTVINLDKNYQLNPKNCS